MDTNNLKFTKLTQYDSPIRDVVEFAETCGQESETLQNQLIHQALATWQRIHQIRRTVRRHLFVSRLSSTVHLHHATQAQEGCPSPTDMRETPGC